jgi:hypothetical protein
MPIFSFLKPSKIYPNCDFWFENYTIWQPCHEAETWQTVFRWLKNAFFPRWKGIGEKKGNWRDCTRVARWYIFRTKNPKMGLFWRALGLENVGAFAGRLKCYKVYLVYFIAHWYLCIISPVLVFLPRKIWQPWIELDFGHRGFDSWMRYHVGESNW